MSDPVRTADIVAAPSSPQAGKWPIHYDRVQGKHYNELLGHLHDTLKPSTYFEIGTRNGGSLAKAKCASLAVDPDLEIKVDIVGKKPACLIYQVTSDAFFQRHDPAAILGGPIDLAFLDGMHLFEFLLRDFANTERFCRPNSVIVLHDCLPGEFPIARRRMQGDPIKAECLKPNYWTGDVWKVLPILQQYRPDLKIVVTDARPTGLVLITGLDPMSTVLKDNYQKITREFYPAGQDHIAFEAFWETVEITPTAKLDQFVDLAGHFWL